MGNLIKLENITLSIDKDGKKKTLLEDFSLSISKGSRIGITGPSGCGKTTLLRNLIRSEKTSSSNNSNFYVNENIKIGYIPQSDGLLPWYSLERNFMHFTSTQNITEDYAKTIISEMKLDKSMTNFPDELSGGELQRALLACSIVSQPDIYLADEPLTEVDLEKKWSILTLWSNYMRKQKAALLLVSHDVDTLVYLCDEIIVLSSNSSGKPSHISKKFKIDDRHPRKREDMLTGDAKKTREDLMMFLMGNT